MAVMIEKVDLMWSAAVPVVGIDGMGYMVM
jgi:hypothetical protein